MGAVEYKDTNRISPVRNECFVAVELEGEVLPC